MRRMGIMETERIIIRENKLGKYFLHISPSASEPNRSWYFWRRNNNIIMFPSAPLPSSSGNIHTTVRHSWKPSHALFVLYFVSAVKLKISLVTLCKNTKIHIYTYFKRRRESTPTKKEVSLTFVIRSERQAEGFTIQIQDVKYEPYLF
jgi:hypothetical protein